MERSSSSSDGDLVDVDPIPMANDDTRESASQQEEQHEDVGEPLIVDYASYDVVFCHRQVLSGGNNFHYKRWQINL